MTSRLINVFRTVPKELFRVNNGRYIRLREYGPQRKKIYDIVTEAGNVKPKALDPQTYEAPNGASMRPNSPYQHRLVSRFRDVVVYSVPEGTPLPDDLILVHEHADHYSLQAATHMSLNDLNAKITAFLESCGRVYSKEQWLKVYTEATDTAASTTTTTASSSQQAA